MAPNNKAWVKGRLYLATTASGAARPLLEAVDFSYDPGLATEERPYAGASVTPNIVLLSSPSLQINFNRRADDDHVGSAYRFVRDNLESVRFYLYMDISNEAAVYAYGQAVIEGVSLSGAATAGINGSFTLKPGPEAVWSDASLIM